MWVAGSIFKTLYFLFFVTYNEWAQLAGVFVTGRPFMLSLNFWVRPGAYPRVQKSKLERLVTDKHSSLFGLFISYEKSIVFVTWTHITEWSTQRFNVSRYVR